MNAKPYKSSTCRSCGARIIWAKTASGKAMPVDAEETADGNVFLAALVTGVYATIPPAGKVIPHCTRHTSHFASCPNANQHRKR